MWVACAARCLGHPSHNADKAQLACLLCCCSAGRYGQAMLCGII